MAAWTAIEPKSTTQKGLPVSRKPLLFSELDGGRDKDRTCDPYDVNTVAAPECPENLGTSSRENPEQDPLSRGFLGHNLGEISPPIGIAAMWLSQHRDEISGSAIAFVKENFDLTAMEAVRALQLGHKLRYGG